MYVEFMSCVQGIHGNPHWTFNIVMISFENTAVNIPLVFQTLFGIFHDAPLFGILFNVSRGIPK